MTRDAFCHDGKALTELIDKAINITGMPHVRADKVPTGKGLSSLRPLSRIAIIIPFKKAASCLAPRHTGSRWRAGAWSVARRVRLWYGLCDFPGGMLITSQTSASHRFRKDGDSSLCSNAHGYKGKAIDWNS